MSEHDIPGFLEPTFEFLVGTLRMQAEVHLGLLRMDGTEAGSANLPMARHMIDMLAMLGEKTRGNLTLEENRMLENSVTELRFRFVQISGQARSGNEGPADTSGAGPSGQGSAGQGSAG